MKHIHIQGHPPVCVGNIFCIGRNYAEHISELGNRQEEEPVVFLKPTSALSEEDVPICLPHWSDDVHYEAELVLLLGQGGRNIPEAQALSHVVAYGLGLDLTARDRQEQAKKSGLPWTMSKGFDQSACVSEFIPSFLLNTPKDCCFELYINDELRQRGQTKQMLFGLETLISYLSSIFCLSAGDLIFTGTPQGVGRLEAGDRLYLKLENLVSAQFVIATHL